VTFGLLDLSGGVGHGEGAMKGHTASCTEEVYAVLDWLAWRSHRSRRRWRGGSTATGPRCSTTFVRVPSWDAAATNWRALVIRGPPPGQDANRLRASVFARVASHARGPIRRSRGASWQITGAAPSFLGDCDRFGLPAGMSVMGSRDRAACPALSLSRV
jgi:hypothetical protein